MEFTQYSEVNNVLTQVQSGIRDTLRDNVVGLYLYGSTTAGDFDSELSDVDLLAITKNPLSNDEFSRLESMHDKFSTTNPQWHERVEVVYISEDDLKNFKNHPARIAKIGPGEPLGFKEADKDWLINWYVIRQSGISMFGPKADEIIPFVSQEEYLQAIKDKTVLWKEALDEYSPESSRGSVAYAVFTLCRILYSYENKEQASKKKSAEWISEKFPQWKNVVDKATKWRSEQWTNNQQVGNDLPTAISFLKFAISNVIEE